MKKNRPVGGATQDGGTDVVTNEEVVGVLCSPKSTHCLRFTKVKKKLKGREETPTTDRKCRSKKAKNATKFAETGGGTTLNFHD